VRKYRGFLILAQAGIARARDKSKKTLQTPEADTGILLWAVTSRGSPQVILFFFNPAGVDISYSTSDHGRTVVIRIPAYRLAPP
jgi:hypothetical protein